MHALRASHLGELLAELRPLCEGARVREIQPLPPRDLLVVLEPLEEGGPAVRRIRLSADPEGPRVHLQQGRAFKHRGSVGSFFDRAAALLVGSTLAAIEQPRGDRIALLRFRDATGEVPRPALVAELTGRHANLVLLDGRELVQAILVPPPSKAGATPRLIVGQPWTPPPGKPGTAADDEPLAIALPEPEVDDEDARPRRIDGPLSWRVEWHIGGAADGARTARESKGVRQRLERKLSRARSLADGLERRREAAAGAERVLQDAELLKAAMGQLHRGLESIELQDWYDDGATRVIALDPKLSPQANVQRQFDRYHKLERSAGEIEREAGLAAKRIAAIEGLLEDLAEGAAPEEIEQRAVAAKFLEPLGQDRAKRVQVQAARLPYRTFTGRAGGEILVGRNARDNDQLSLRIARGNDLWLHTADSPGSHVILRVAKDREPNQEDVLDAAHLAAHFSPLRDAGRVAVHLALRKQIRKPKGAPPGMVQVGGGKIRQIRIEPDRLERLLSTDRGGDDPGAPAGGPGPGSGR
ncbi:NFACT family protein [Engelhardtia mirabilis]|uniref:NFACT protein RNA binding domain-containing protein n=1 Tax=Engelhardtia mirabilis TaxID=2528011 RepID=A0A518BK41_9BACT|nr:hypothetical protein Pla133_24240 [Planctomycetes bacterium Pla133]QDV01668.1 hypothetical protein Pla86_24230 [Planctomycetes bacterium Pla86]